MSCLIRIYAVCRCYYFWFWQSLLLVKVDRKLTLKAPITAAADDTSIFFHCFSEKIRLDILSESSARQRIHMKHQALFP